MSSTLAGDEGGLIAYYAFDVVGAQSSENLAVLSAEPGALLLNGAEIVVPRSVDTDLDGIRDGCACDGSFTLDVAHTAPIAGSTGSASFDGIDDEASALRPADFSIANSSFTVEAWVLRETSVPGVEEFYFLHGDEVANRGLHIGFRDSGAFVFGFWANDLDTPFTVPLDRRWRHYACVYDATTMERRVYIDGFLAASDISPSDFVGSSGITLGNLRSPRFFNGRIDELRVWNVARTQAEIRETLGVALFGGTLPAELVAYWPLDEVGELDGREIVEDFAGFNELVPPDNQRIDYVPLAPDRDGDLVSDGCEPCLADLNNDGALGFFDVAVLLRSVAVGDPRADLDADGTVDGGDVQVLLGEIAIGCP
ncbi:MAG: LamG-like jellyroll fold domain-containing protein [Planctomycetota bacterium]